MQTLFPLTEPAPAPQPAPVATAPSAAAPAASTPQDHDDTLRWMLFTVGAALLAYAGGTLLAWSL